ncbi:hypothetical protein UVI_02041040 [Ustilaginoidea virens]|uniref:Uncharacterized protein n=1 Tax=Ustilaginoidea virens TaxID=1159556 RepID=A0A1B5KW84_USTVR|nr:hypothetical protein UVI_02041040 [Ustilaginoidea virens]
MYLPLLLKKVSNIVVESCPPASRWSGEERRFDSGTHSTPTPLGRSQDPDCQDPDCQAPPGCPAEYLDWGKPFERQTAHVGTRHADEGWEKAHVRLRGGSLIPDSESIHGAEELVIRIHGGNYYCNTRPSRQLDGERCQDWDGIPLGPSFRMETDNELSRSKDGGRGWRAETTQNFPPLDLGLGTWEQEVGGGGGLSATEGAPPGCSWTRRAWAWDGCGFARRFAATEYGVVSGLVWSGLVWSGQDVNFFKPGRPLR